VSADPVVVVHGGAGRAPRGPDDEHHRALGEAVDGARAALAGGGAALDAAQAAVELLEDCPHFNAGRGSVLTADGAAELDAAVMSGPDRAAGAVAGVTTVRHPVALARAVMEETQHVLLAGAGAERLAERLGLERVEPDWFVTERESARHGRAAEEAAGGGTVGAVVRDGEGRLAAATSTGGVRGQLPGRVGDSPLPGAGTYADDLVAVSGTGHGEAMMRTVAAHELAALVRHAGLSVEEAARRAIDGLGELGSGGLIAVGVDGSVAMPFTTPAMHRGWAVGDEPARTAIGP
jgi:isoaspartyl peptidase/L-asparaginase-like protein (Ntn-hydrolase superfamily)